MCHPATQISAVPEPAHLSMQASHVQMELRERWQQQSTGQLGSERDHHCWRCAWHRTGPFIPRLLPREYGTHYGMQGKSIWGYHRTYGIFQGKTKSREKEGPQGGLWRKRHGKTEWQGDRRDQSHVNRLLDSAFVWSRPVPDGLSLSCPLIKLHFSLFSWVKGLCSVCKGVYGE